MKYFFTLFIAAFFSVLINAQHYNLTGKVTDNLTRKPLSYANIRIAGTNTGTSASLDGKFLLKLPEGNTKIICSFIGYVSDTLEIKIAGNKELEILLNPVSIELGEVLVKPGINPAIAVIENAVRSKKVRNQKLNNYEFHAFSKAVMRSNRDFATSGRGISVSPFGTSTSDSNELKIAGIMENESRGFYSKPDFYKDIIVARKQTANFPSRVNILTGSRILVNFYDELVNFGGFNIPSPISDEALDYYYYYIKDSLAFNNSTIYQINFSPEKSSKPGFTGDIFIAKDDYTLRKVDVSLNAAANPGGVFDSLRIFQQYLEYDGIFMPIDYRITGQMGFLGLKFAFDFGTVMNNYRINKTMDVDLNDKVIVKVNPDADKKDSVYWSDFQTIPVTLEESRAYVKFDSLKNVPRSFFEKNGLFDFSWNINDNHNITAPLGLYDFNKVEGHSLDLAYRATDILDQRLSYNANLRYGFNDKKFKQNASFTLRTGEYRTGILTLRLFNKTESLFENNIFYSRFSSTVLSLFSKYDFRDYFYRKGFEVTYTDDVTDMIRLGLGYFYNKDNNAVNNSDFSFFYKSRKYSANRAIQEGNYSLVQFSYFVNFQPRFIEDGYFRTRISSDGARFFILGNVRSSVGGDKFTIFSNSAFFSTRLFNNSFVTANLNSVHSTGKVPLQFLTSLAGNIENQAKPNSFRTIRINEYAGDRVATANINFFFGKDLFNLLSVPFLPELDINLDAFINIGYVNNSQNSSGVFKTLKTPLAEAGFSIGQGIVPLRLSFAWRLNHIEKTNFYLGINTAIIF